MRKILTSRLFRCLICLILVCSLLVMWSPVKAHAVLIESAMLYELGLIALGLLGVSGIVIATKNALEVQAVGKSWTDFVFSKAQTQEDINITWDFFQLSYQAANAGKPPKLEWKVIAAIIATATADWIVTVSRNKGEVESAVYQPSGSIIPVGTYAHSHTNDIYLEFNIPVSKIGWYSISDEGKYFCEVAYGAFVDSTSDLSGYFNYPSGTRLQIGSSNFRSLTVDGRLFRYFFGYGYATQGIAGLYDGSLSDLTFGQFIIATLNGTIDHPQTETIQPEFITGDIGSVLESGQEIETITIPDIDFGGISITEDETYADAFLQLQTQLANGTITWQQYLDLISNGSSVNITINTGGNNNGTDPGTDPDPGTGTGSWEPPSDMGKFTLDLKQYFPFCIPFDLYAFFTCLNAEPVAPVIEWIIPLPGGKTYPFEIDLSAFDSVAQILRRMQLLLFCVGLAFKTRDLIKG